MPSPRNTSEWQEFSALAKAKRERLGFSGVVEVDGGERFWWCKWYPRRSRGSAHSRGARLLCVRRAPGFARRRTDRQNRGASTRHKIIRTSASCDGDMVRILDSRCGMRSRGHSTGRELLPEPGVSERTPGQRTALLFDKAAFASLGELHLVQRAVLVGIGCRNIRHILLSSRFSNGGSVSGVGFQPHRIAIRLAHFSA